MDRALLQKYEKIMRKGDFDHFTKILDLDYYIHFVGDDAEDDAEDDVRAIYNVYNTKRDTVTEFLKKFNEKQKCIVEFKKISEKYKDLPYIVIDK